MPVERVVIKPDEFRTRDANGNTTFWSGNQYLKTDAAGQFKAGGYERAPCVVGYSSIYDHAEYGGYYGYAWSVAGIETASTTYPNVPSVSAYLPYASGNTVTPFWIGGPPILMSQGAVISDWLMYSFNGIPNYGSYRLLGDVRGVPTGDPSIGGVRPAAIMFKISDFTPVGAGTYTFYKGNTYYLTSNGSVYTGTIPKYWYGLNLFYTKPPVNLELTVTP